MAATQSIDACKKNRLRIELELFIHNHLKIITRKYIFENCLMEICINLLACMHTIHDIIPR